MLNIIAIGGGGFTHGTHPSLEDFCLAQTGIDQPAVGYIGTASQDDPAKVERFQDRFAGVARRHVHLAMDLSARALTAELKTLDPVSYTHLTLPTILLV